jgi:hypothetical protein
MCVITYGRIISYERKGNKQKIEAGRTEAEKWMDKWFYKDGNPTQ